MSINLERFTHGTIGLYCVGRDWYVSIVYYRWKKHKCIVYTDCTRYCGFNAYVRAFVDYMRKRQYLGELSVYANA